MENRCGTQWLGTLRGLDSAEGNDCIETQAGV